MNAALQPIQGIPWYHIDDPRSAALDELARRFRLHPLQIEDCRHRPQRAKAEEHDEYWSSTTSSGKAGSELVPGFLGWSTGFSRALQTPGV